MNLQYSPPTINEIRAARKREPHHSCASDKRYSVYRQGDFVRFVFNNKQLRGRVTRAICDNGLFSYHIETPDHKWYRNVDSQKIIGKV